MYLFSFILVFILVSGPLLLQFNISCFVFVFSVCVLSRFCCPGTVFQQVPRRSADKYGPRGSNLRSSGPGNYSPWGVVNSENGKTRPGPQNYNFQLWADHPPYASRYGSGGGGQATIGNLKALKMFVTATPQIQKRIRAQRLSSPLPISRNADPRVHPYSKSAHPAHPYGLKGPRPRLIG